MSAAPTPSERRGARGIERVAVISLHTSPLLQPGEGDSGGMNVYVRETVSALSQLGVHCTTYTRAHRRGLAPVVWVEPNHRVVHIEAGPHHLPKEALPEIIDEFTDRVLDDIAATGGVDIVHANYWLSGVAAHRIKHELDIPFVSTFHTLARVKAEGGDHESAWRERAEAELINCCDAICVSCDSERAQFHRLYGDPTGQVDIISPGVDHALFGPGNRDGARHALGWDLGAKTVLFVGRIQPLKGPDVAVRAVALLADPDVRLVIVGGASGDRGDEEMARVRGLIRELNMEHRVEVIPPQPHHLLATYYRAADVVIVPSRSESFGLVALESAACGTPVVASAVGGLLSLVDHGQTGFLVPNRTPAAFANAIGQVLGNPALAEEMSVSAVELAREYTWRQAGLNLLDLYRSRLLARERVDCQ